MKAIKKTAICLSTIVIVFICFLCYERRVKADTYGDFTYSVNGNKVTITGYTGTDTKVTVPSKINGKKVTKIGDRAFYRCYDIKSISLPESIVEFGSDAFCSCHSLTDINIPKKLSKIGDHAFSSCTSIKTIILPNTVTNIGRFAFYYCTELTSITLPNSITDIKTSTFACDYKLNNLVIPDSVTELCEYSITDCHALTNITLPDSIVKIGDRTFAGCPITTFNFKTNKIIVNPGDSFSIPIPIIKALSERGYECTLSSGKKSVVSVDGESLKALKAGEAKISLKIKDKTVKGSWNVVVEFEDVTSTDKKYYYQPVYWAVNNGITNGIKNAEGIARTFGPELECTREQMVTFLWRMAGKPEPTISQSPFSDVPSNGEYYSKAVLWAYSKGITKGYSTGEKAGTFGVGDSVSREDCVTFLYRAANKPKVSSMAAFSDVEKGKYYEKPIAWASSLGITKGYTSGEKKGKFGVGEACLREHIVTFMYRYFCS